jgi:hypothetical protein
MSIFHTLRPVKTDSYFRPGRVGRMGSNQEQSMNRTRRQRHL